MNNKNPIIVSACDPALQGRAHALAAKLGLYYCPMPEDLWCCFSKAGRPSMKHCALLKEYFKSDMGLILTPARLILQEFGPNAAGPVYVEFISGKAGYRQRRYATGELLARAVGLKGEYQPVVLDATAGLGRDAFVLATYGCQVRLLERSSILSELLLDGLQRANVHAQTSRIITRMSLIQADAISWMEDPSSDFHLDVVYLDPMYPPRLKAAQVKKEMRLLRVLAGADKDAGLLLRKALDYARKRVVVKRPLHAENLGNLSPSFSYTGQSTRFDVYIAA